MASPDLAALEVDRSSPSRAHLLAHLQAADTAIRTMIVSRRSVDPEPEDAFRGLYLSDPHIDSLLERDGRVAGPSPVTAALAGADEEAAHASAAGHEVRLHDVARRFDLLPVETHLLVLAALPDLDPRVEQFYGYLNDDVSRRRLTVGLALALCGLSSLDGEARAVLDGSATLLREGLVRRLDEELPVLGRSLRVPDRVTAHLLGDDRLPAELIPLVMDVAPVELTGIEPIVETVRHDGALVYLRGAGGSAAAAAGWLALAERGAAPLCLDLRSSSAPVTVGMARTIVREARLRGISLVLHGFDHVAAADPVTGRILADAPVGVIATGRDAWDPTWAATVPLAITAPNPSTTARAQLWRRAISASADAPEPPRDLDGANGSSESVVIRDPVDSMAGFALSPEQIVRASEAAAVIARSEGRPVCLADLQAGARAQNAAGLERLARRLQPVATWAHLVLNEQARHQLEELAVRCRHRTTVLGTHGMGRKASAGGGVSALFAGASGTGKTLAAEVIAGSMGLDLYVIDLSTVVDKYIGETEKNLDRVFEQAEQVNGVLLFDEADALFGKRSDVSDAHDRYANVEVAYLLQRMEAFDGIAFLTTNLRSNIDPAFLRRLDAVVEFAKPDPEHRRRLWDLNLPPSLPRGDDIDLQFLAESFPLTGGEIRNACVTAAYLAVDGERSVSMADLIRGTGREYRKLGRMIVSSEFGPYLTLLDGI